jgi:hypothetical protein
MSRVLCCSHTLFRSLRLSRHVNKPISNTSYYLLQRRFAVQASIQTIQDVSKPETMNVDQLYQQAKRLVEAKRRGIERSMLEVGSKATRVPSDTLPDYTRFPKPEKCLKAEKRLLEAETTLERDVFLMSLVTNVVKPREVVTIQQLVDRLIQNYQGVLDEHELIAKVTSKTDFCNWLHKPMLKQCIIIDTPDMNDVASTREKHEKRMMQAFDHTTIQWNGLTVEKIVEGFDAKDYGLEVFPSEVALYLPHVSVTAEEAKERRLSSDQLQKLNEEIMHYYEVR